MSIATAIMPIGSSHGYKYEQAVNEEYGYKPAEDRFARWDARASIPISSKTLKIGHELNLGSIRNIADINEEFILHVAFWQDKPENIVEEYRLFITPDIWKSYLGNLDFLNYVYTAMKTVDFMNDQKWLELTNHYKQSYGEAEALIKLRFSRNKKKPDLKPVLKCAIGYKQFMEHVIKDNIILKYRKM